MPNNYLSRQVGARAANERVSHLKETQQPADLAGDADAHTSANVRGLPNRSAKPKRPIGTQVNSIQPLVDLQCNRKPPRPSCQVHQFVGFAASLHQADSLERFQRAQKHSCADPQLFSRDIEHVGRPIDDVNVSEPSAQEQGVVACRLSAIGMPARIAWGISLCLDNAAANPVSPHVADDRLPNKISGQLSRIDWQAGP